MKIWLDDIRPAPDDTWVTCTTAEQAIGLINIGKGVVTYISFDHDLGEGATGYDVAKHIEHLSFTAGLPMIGYDVHSANPVGRENIGRAMTRAWQYSDSRLK